MGRLMNEIDRVIDAFRILRYAFSNAMIEEIQNWKIR